MTTQPKPISWDVPAGIPKVGGTKVSGGVFVPNHPQAGRAVDFGAILPKGQRLVVRLAGKPELEAELARWEREEKEYRIGLQLKKAEERRQIETGEKAIEPKYHDGEYLSGYEVFGQEAEMLAAIGAAKQVDGWGTEVEPKLIATLGKSFTYPQAVEFVRPAQEAATAKREAAAASRAEKFAEAQRTGKPVVLRTWTETRRAQEGGELGEYLFACTEYANPDGSTKTTAINSY